MLFDTYVSDGGKTATQICLIKHNTESIFNTSKMLVLDLPQ